MSSSNTQIRQFLVSRRAKITPALAGIPEDDDRRVPGLRREEVARLAGVSVDYYVKLERGNVRSASDSVLTAIARALQLTDEEREHLFHLVQDARSVVPAEKETPAEVRSSVQRVLDNMTVPAIVQNVHQDLIAANLLGRALYAPQFDTAGTPNIARFIFLDPRAQDYYRDWPLARRLTAAMLRLAAGRDPLNRELTALIGELSTRSIHFASEWAAQDVHEHRTGGKVFVHPAVGPIELTYDVFEMPGEPGLSIVTYSVEPNTPDADKFVLLSSWAATQDFAADNTI